jgi:hypothetical protein
MSQQDLAQIYEDVLEDNFDDSLLNTAYQKLLDGQVAEGMDELVVGLRDIRVQSSEHEWRDFVEVRCLHHPLKDLLHQDPFTFRAFSKPRGYAGDAEMLDYIYGHEERWPVPDGTSAIGGRIFEYTTRAPAPEGVRARREYIAKVLDRLSEEKPKPEVLSVAAGHLREASLGVAVKRGKLGRLVALDSDAESLEAVQENYGCFGVEVKEASVRRILSGRLDLGKFDLVYSTGLFDYLQQPVGQRLAAVMFGMLRPGGKVVVANFLPGIRDIGYMESYMAWYLIYRNRQEMLELAASIPQTDIRDIRIFTEDNQNIIFLQVTKR